MNRLKFSATILLLACSAVAGAAGLPTPAAPQIGAKSYIVIDSQTGRELAAVDPDLPLAPASLTKIMTTYVVFSAIADGQITLDDEVTISEKAWRTEGSRMFIEVGTRVTVRDLLMGLIVQSGNDAGVALAEHIAGTEQVFAQMMNQHAMALGMTASLFQNATGLPADGHVTTARDLAVLARALIEKFPERYAWHAIREFTYNDIRQENRNSLLWRDESVDGIKTGHTDDAGFCLVASAKRDDMRVISVVLGTDSNRARTDGSQALLNYAFRFFETRKLYSAGDVLTTARVWKSAAENSSAGVLEDIYLTLPRGRYDELQSSLRVSPQIMAPVAAGQPLGELDIRLDGETLLAIPVRALDDNPVGSFWQRSRDSVSLWFE